MVSLLKRAQSAGVCPWQTKTWVQWYEIPNHLKPVATDANPSSMMARYFYNYAVKLLEPSPIEYLKKQTHFGDKNRANRVTGISKVMVSSNAPHHPLLKKFGEYKIKSGWRAQHCNPCDPCQGGSSRNDPSKDLKNKVIVITGGAEGIGYIIADYYLNKSAKCAILLDINEEVGCKNLNKLTTKYGCDKAEFMKCNVITDLEKISNSILCKHKTVDVLINNAGVLNERDIKRTIDVNVAAAIEWGYKFWSHMRKDKGGKGGTIINISSIYGFRVNQYLPTYQASKFAMMGFTKALGHEYNFKKTGVRVMAICPGFTPTTLTENFVCWDELSEEDFKTFVKGNKWQKLKTVGQAAVDSFEMGNSGIAWLIEGGKKIREVVISHTHDKPITA